MFLRRLLLLVTLIALCIGCGGEFPTANVSGRITVNGKPVEKVAVMFQPVAAEGKINSGIGSTGISDADGRYTLILIGTKNTKGAVIGKHKVRFENYTDPGDTSDDRSKPKRTQPTVRIPQRYYDKPMDYDVTSGGTAKADFDLTSP
jgi:hypothetical protein